MSYKDYDHPRTMAPQTPPLVYCSAPGWMPSRPPQEQARALLQELEALHVKRDLQALPELKWTQELQRLCRVWGFPQVLVGELQELLVPQEPPKRLRHSWPSNQGATRGSSGGSGGNLPHFGEEGSPPGPGFSTKVKPNYNDPTNPYPPHVRPPQPTREPKQQLEDPVYQDSNDQDSAAQESAVQESAHQELTHQESAIQESAYQAATNGAAEERAKDEDPPTAETVTKENHLKESHLRGEQPKRKPPKGRPPREEPPGGRQPPLQHLKGPRDH